MWESKVSISNTHYHYSYVSALQKQPLVSCFSNIKILYFVDTGMCSVIIILRNSVIYWAQDQDAPLINTAFKDWLKFVKTSVL